MLGWDLWTLGFPYQAFENVLLALEEARDSANPDSVAFAHYVTSAGQAIVANINIRSGMPIRASRYLGTSDQPYKLYSRFGRGCALARMG